MSKQQFPVCSTPIRKPQQCRFDNSELFCNLSPIRHGRSSSEFDETRISQITPPNLSCFKSSDSQYKKDPFKISSKEQPISMPFKHSTPIKKSRSKPFHDLSAIHGDPFGDISRIIPPPPPKTPEEEERSSFYDTGVPESELEYFSSEWSDYGMEHPEPISRRRDRYRNLLNRYIALDGDLPYQENRKFLKSTQIQAEFRNFCNTKRAMKGMARLKSVKAKNFKDPAKEADLLLRLELYDKKLDRDYLYDPNESPVFRDLLEKRKRAIDRKYKKYRKHGSFRKKFQEKVYVQMQQITKNPLFEQDEEPDTEEDNESSLNDTEIPTSEEEFMSSGLENLELPVMLNKPLTRNKKDLYEHLDKVESMIENEAYGDTTDYKKLLRYNLIQRFKRRLIDRRKAKAFKRFQNAMKLATKDRGIIATQLYEMEIRDKKLDKGYLYYPGEPEVYVKKTIHICDFMIDSEIFHSALWDIDLVKKLIGKRLRAIKRKLIQFMKNKEFRNKYEQRLLQEWIEVRLPGQEAPEDDDKPFFDSYTDNEGIFDNRTIHSHAGSFKEYGARKVETARDRAIAGIWPKRIRSVEF